MSEDNNNRAAKIVVMAVPLVMFAVVGYAVYAEMNEAAQPQFWANDHPEQVQYYEGQCNDRFGYEWEFYPGEEVMTPGQEQYTITCGKDTGFLSGTTEQITVPSPNEASS